MILQLTEDKIKTKELIDELLNAFDYKIEIENIKAYITKLVASGMLITELHDANSRKDREFWLLKKLKEAGLQEHSLYKQLKEIVTFIDQYNK